MKQGFAVPRLMQNNWEAPAEAGQVTPSDRPEAILFRTIPT